MVTAARAEMAEQASLQQVQLLAVPSRPFQSFVAVALCDAISLLAAFSLILSDAAIRQGLTTIQGASALVSLMAFLGLVFASFGLYPGIIHNPVAELRRIVLALLLSYLAIFFVLLRSGELLRVPPVVLLSCMLALLLTPFCRLQARKILCKQAWWGAPVAVFHTGAESTDLIAQLQKNRANGLIPVAILENKFASKVSCPLPSIDMRQATSVIAAGVKRAIIVVPDN